MAYGIVGTRAHSGQDWKTLRIGGGGYCSGVDIHPTTGDLVCRIDVYGGYYLPQGDTIWRQLISSASMPAAFCFSNATSPTSNVGADPYLQAGIEEVRFAPSDSNILYMFYMGWMFKSVNKGVTWSNLSGFTRVTTWGANDLDPRSCGQKIAVDPVNANVVYLGTKRDGLWKTVDGGTTWVQIATASVPVATASTGGFFYGISGIAFDPTATATTTTPDSHLETPTLIVSSAGNGCYRTSNKGTTWALLTGGPTSVGGLRTACFSSAGVYYGCALDQSGVWKYTGTWTNITPTGNAGSWNTISVNPFDATHVCAVQFSAHVAVSHNSGGLWDTTTTGTPTVTSSDVPYFVNDGDPSLGESSVVFDPLTARKLWLAGGTGMYYTQLPSGSTALTSPSTWVGLSAGQETLVANTILSPPGGYPIVTSWDRPTWTIQDPDAYQANYGPNYRVEIVSGWSVDFAKDNNSVIVAFNTFGFGNDPGSSAYSTNKGITWTQFTQPYDASVTGVGGCIAARTTLNWVVCCANDAGQPKYTTDGGSTWNAITLPAGVPTTGELGWNHFGSAPRQFIWADSTQFYLYNYMVPALYTSPTGLTWTAVLSAYIDPASAAWNMSAGKGRLVTGNDGKMAWCSGPIGNPGDGRTPASNFRYSATSGASWITVPNLKEVQDFGWGAAGPSNSGFPTCFAAGWLSGVYGVWQSTGTAADWAAGTQTWARVGSFSPLPLNSTDWLKCVNGDMNVVGRCYVGFTGSGFAYFG